jgi:quinol monooxygenase YgiN
MSKVGIIAKMTAKEGQRDGLVAALKPLLDAAKDEPGTEIYAMHTDTATPELVWFYELYTDQDAMIAHGTSEAMKAAGASLAPLLEGRPELYFLAPEAAKGLSL